MPKKILVPDVPAPTKQLCWKPDPRTFKRCDRMVKHGGLRLWEMMPKPKPVAESQ